MLELEDWVAQSGVDFSGLDLGETRCYLISVVVFVTGFPFTLFNKVVIVYKEVSEGTK